MSSRIRRRSARGPRILLVQLGERSTFRMRVSHSVIIGPNAFRAPNTINTELEKGSSTVTFPPGPITGFAETQEAYTGLVHGLIFYGDLMRRILLVDDNDATRALCRRNLEDSYEIIEAADPKLAFPLGLEYKPDAILMQLSMSRLSGIRVMQNVLRISAYKTYSDLCLRAPRIREIHLSCLRMGVSGYLEKPIDFARLRSDLAKVLLSRTPGASGTRESPTLSVILKLKGKDTDGKHCRKFVRLP